MAEKVNKTLADFEGQQPLFKSELEIFDTAANHNKFWRCYVYPADPEHYYVARHWGRNGSKGQQMVEYYYGHYNAIGQAEVLSNEKKRKGYRPEASPLDKIVREV